MWANEIPAWYAVNGRHALPWRQTTDPWAVLVSEVMLQQTSVARVLPRWGRFLDRWPATADCAAAALEDVLREWQGLGYPRRARGLWLSAARVVESGWPRDEAGLRTLPGVGVYTARALLAFSDLGDASSPPPRDVNIARVVARAAMGREPADARPAALDHALTAGRPAALALRNYAYALFDIGASHCRARPRCGGCPLARGCASVDRLAQVPPRAQPAKRYHGSLRQLRGALLTHALAEPDRSPAALARAVAHVPGATPARVAEAIQGLVTDGLLTVPGTVGR